MEAMELDRDLLVRWLEQAKVDYASAEKQAMSLREQTCKAERESRRLNGVREALLTLIAFLVWPPGYQDVDESYRDDDARKQGESRRSDLEIEADRARDFA